MAGKRKQYTPEFKFKVVLESLQRDTTLEEVCQKYSVTSSMVSRWRQALQQKGPEIFRDQRDPASRSKAQGYEPGESPDELKKLIGELTVQNEILKKPEDCWASEQTVQSRAGAHAVCFRQSDQ
jgi:transposase